jgi:hypothetical protein
MMEDKLQISDLTFNGIRDSLIEFMKSTDVFKDYDFQGSGMRTLIDLLAYNTFYYGFYSNMIANEMFLDTAQLEKSVISLTKPLGYVVAGSLSSVSTVRLSNLNLNYDNVSYFSTFKGVDQNGSIYYFFNINDIPIKTVVDGESSYGQTDYFPIYEAKNKIFRQTLEVDIESQTVFLEGNEIDPRTIVVEVSYDGEEYEKLVNYYNNPDEILDETTKVFFIERKSNGYNLIFSKQSTNDVNSGGLGKPITDLDLVRISYLIGSGSPPNGIASFDFVSDSSGNSITSPNTFVTTLIAARNGRETANLDEVKFFAPKTFARQNRLVTKGDYYAILNELGYSSGDDPDYDFKVFGGEEASPPYFGRVFISILDLDSEDNSELNQVTQILSIVKNKSIVTVLPEYIPPLEVDINLLINGVLPGGSVALINTRKNAIKNVILQSYGRKKYNTHFLINEIIQLCRTIAPEVTITSDNIFITASLRMSPSSTPEFKRINFKNTLQTLPIGNVEIKFDDTLIPFVIKDAYVQKKLFRYRKDNGSLFDDKPIGEVDYQNGVVTIYPNDSITTSFYTVIANTKDKIGNDDAFYAKDEFIAYVKNENLQINISPV